MKEKILIITCLICVSFLMVGIGAAQDNQTGIPTKIIVSDLFTWLYRNPPDLVAGATYFILGFVGALAAIYGLIGDVVPGTKWKSIARCSHETP